MTTRYAGRALSLNLFTHRVATHAALILGFAAPILLGALSAAVQTSSAASGASNTTAQTYEALRERVRTEQLTAVTDQRFPVFLFIGRWSGGRLSIGIGLNDPEDPNTLDRNFANWNLTARASLLLSYAKLRTEPDTARKDVPATDENIRLARANEAASHARIAQIVGAGKYEASWQPFVLAYRKLVKSAETIVPPGNAPDGDTRTLDAISGLAREHGMFRLVRELPIDAGDVANEMLRLVANWRVMSGAPTAATNHPLNLFYVCDATIRIHTWHSLAPAFLRAWDAADKKLDDPQARLIMTTFDGIGKDIKAWAAAHPDADSLSTDRAVNEMAKTRGLYSLLTK